MNKFIKIFVCFSILLASLFSFSGCKRNHMFDPADQAGTIWATEDFDFVIFVAEEYIDFYDARPYADYKDSEVYSYTANSNMYGYFIKDGERYDFFVIKNPDGTGISLCSTKISEREKEGLNFYDFYYESEYNLGNFTDSFHRNKYVLKVKDNNGIFEEGTKFTLYRYKNS